LYYLKLRLEIQDQTLLNRLIDALSTERKQHGILFGDTLARLVTVAEPKTAKTEIDVMIKVLNAFYAGKFSFKKHPWRTEQIAEFKQHLVPIELVPVR
jgi:hypothetical protein